MKTVNIDGVEYVEKDKGYQDSAHVCIIADKGWIFEGVLADDDITGKPARLTGANVVRRWDNGLGIGAIADPEHKDDYTLDYIGDITIMEHAVIAVIPLRW